jgi:hypothetical protein
MQRDPDVSVHIDGAWRDGSNLRNLNRAIWSI